MKSLNIQENRRRSKDNSSRNESNKNMMSNQISSGQNNEKCNIHMIVVKIIIKKTTNLNKTYD